MVVGASVNAGPGGVVDRLADLAEVDRQYTTEARLLARISIWQSAADGRDPATAALAAVVAEHPAYLVEVGCGTGDFALRIRHALPDTEILATDRSPRMVELTAARGVTAAQATADRLPLPDAWADVAVANWMLYHVPDLDAALAELRRVLRPGGCLIAVTNGDQHLAPLHVEAGGEPIRTCFSSENGAAALHRHFDSVTRDDLSTTAYFADHAAAQAYLATIDARLADGLPWFAGPREVAGHTTVFVAR